MVVWLEAGDLGFEPRLTAPEAVVLPLHQSPIIRGSRSVGSEKDEPDLRKIGSLENFRSGRRFAGETRSMSQKPEPGELTDILEEAPTLLMILS